MWPTPYKGLLQGIFAQSLVLLGNRVPKGFGGADVLGRVGGRTHLWSVCPGMCACSGQSSEGPKHSPLLDLKALHTQGNEA